MAKVKRLSPRKEPIQKRSKVLRQSLLEAATYVLKREGPVKFSTNKVAEKAGVNIASLYQYYPNKEALLFHLIELQWGKTYHAVFPVLKDQSLTHRQRVHQFVRHFFKMEAQDRDLKEAMTHLGYLIENTKEYRDLLAVGQADFLDFLRSHNKRARSSIADFVLHTITSFSECKTADPWLSLEEDSTMMADMVCRYLGFDS